MKHQLQPMVMSEGQGSDTFINELFHLKGELVKMDEVINEDTLPDLFLEDLPDEYTQIKYSAETDDVFSLYITST